MCKDYYQLYVVVEHPVKHPFLIEGVGFFKYLQMFNSQHCPVERVNLSDGCTNCILTTERL